MEAGKLTLRIPGFAMRRLTPTSETEFFDSSAGVWTFHRGPDGKVTHVVLRRRGVDTTLEKME